MISQHDYNVLAQKAHFLAGIVAVFASQIFFHNRNYGAVAIILFALVKEFWYDENYETPEIRGSSAQDFLFYFIGAVFAWIAIGE